MGFFKNPGEGIGEAIGAFIHYRHIKNNISKAQMLDDKKRHKEATYAFEKIIDACPSWADRDKFAVEIWCERAKNLYNSGQYEESLISFERAYEVAYNPQIAEAIKYNKNEVLKKLNR